MAYNIVNNQYLIHARLPLDAKLVPVSGFSELALYEFTMNTFDGMELTVLNGSYPVKVIMSSNGSDSPKKYHWKLNSTLVADTYEDLNGESGLVQTIVSALSTKKNVSGAFEVGQKAIVLADETREGKWSEYIATEVVDGIPTWEYNHADPEKFSIAANSAETSIELYYDGIKVGEAANLEDILRDWQNDQYVASGRVITNENAAYIELSYNDETLPPLLINATDLLSSNYRAGKGVSIDDNVISVDMSGITRDVEEIASRILAEKLIPEDAQESLDTLEEIAAWIQEHPEDAAAMNEKLQALSGAVATTNERIDNIEVGDKNVIENVKLNGRLLDVEDKTVDIVLSAYTTTADVEGMLSDYATSSDTVNAISEATKPSISASGYTEAKTFATAENVGRLINVSGEEIISGTTYSSGLYIVTGPGEISKLGVTSASGDLSGDVEILKGRVNQLETITEALYWETDEDLVI